MKSRSFQELVDAGVLEPKPVKPCWLVRTATGRQFSTHVDEDEAKVWADRIAGSYEWYEPVQAPLPNIGPFERGGHDDGV